MKIRVDRRINAPKDILWSYLADFSNIARFHPMLSHSEFIDNSVRPGIGEQRQCDFNDGNFIRERILEWEEGSHYKVEIYDSSMPIKDAKAVLGVKDLGGGRTKAFMEVEMKAEKILAGAFSIPVV